MVRRRMPLSATWFTLCHVDSTREFRSHIAPCANPQTDSRLWCGLSSRWPDGDNASQNIQCSKLSGIFNTFTAPPAPGMQDGRGTRQCSLASCTRSASVAIQASPGIATEFLTAIQSRFKSSGTCLETYARSLHTQCVLRNTSEIGICCSNTIYEMDSSKFTVASFMRNYLRRCV